MNQLVCGTSSSNLARRRVDRLDDLGRRAARRSRTAPCLPFVAVGASAEREVDALLAVDDLRRLDRAAVEQLETLLGRDLDGSRLPVSRLKPIQTTTTREDDVDERAAEDALEVHVRCGPRARILSSDGVSVRLPRRRLRRLLDVRPRLTASEPGSAVDVRREHARRRAGCGSARRSRGRSRRRTRSGSRSRRTCTSTSTFAASGLRSSAQISTEAGAAALEVLAQPREGEAGVDDVLDDEHVATVRGRCRGLSGCARHRSTGCRRRRTTTAIQSISTSALAARARGRPSP